jgi:rhodanese-related sulfurtransferase
MIEIDPQSLQQKLAGEKPPFLLDVRMPPELVAEGRIEGSVNIPMNQLQQRLAEIPQEGPVVTICKSGMRSMNAAGWLRQTGRDVASLSGGMDRWKALGLPVLR